MADKVLCDKSDLVNVADAVRSKLGVTNTYYVSELSSAIQNIQTGGITPSAAKKPYTMTIRINKYNTSGGGGSGSESTSTRYYVSVSITDGDNTKTVSSRPTLTAGDNLKNTITDILTNNKDSILDTFPANQWIYQWIISTNIDGSLESFFTAFGVTGNENLMNALLNGSPIYSLEVGKEYVLSFEGY